VGFLGPTGNSESVSGTHVALNACISALPTLTSKFEPKRSRINVVQIFFIPRPSKHKVRHNVRLLSPVAYSNSPFLIGFLYFPKLCLPHYRSPLPMTFSFFTFQRSASPPSAYHAVTSDKILFQLPSVPIQNFRPSNYETPKTLNKAVEVFMNIYSKCPRFEFRLGHRLP